MVSVETKRIHHEECPFCGSSIKEVMVNKTYERVGYDCGLELLGFPTLVGVQSPCTNYGVNGQEQYKEIAEIYDER